MNSNPALGDILGSSANICVDRSALDLRLGLVPLKACGSNNELSAFY
jgi:hypothetical protein